MSFFIGVLEKGLERSAFAGATAGIFLGLCSVNAAAHDQWLETEPPAVRPGKGLKLYLQLGEHLSASEPAQIKSRERYVRFEAISAVGRKDLRSSLREDTQPIATLSREARGPMVIALDSTARSIELPPDKFASYLLEERLITVLSDRVERNEEETPGREKYSRSLKLLLLEPVTGERGRRGCADEARGPGSRTRPSDQPLTRSHTGNADLPGLVQGQAVAARRDHRSQPPQHGRTRPAPAHRREWPRDH